MPAAIDCERLELDEIRSSRIGDGGALPLPLFAGEGWGGGASAKRTGREDRPSPTRRSFERVDLPRKRERWTESVDTPIQPTVITLQLFV
jgi:hypothetical protein